MAALHDPDADAACGPPYVRLAVGRASSIPPAVYYGIEDRVVLLWQCLASRIIPFRVEACISMGLAIDTYSADVGYSELVDKLTNWYIWNAAVRASGLCAVVVVPSGWDSGDLMGIWLDKVGRVYSSPIEGDLPWRRPALPFTAILECSDMRELRRLGMELEKQGVDFSHWERS